MSYWDLLSRKLGYQFCLAQPMPIKNYRKLSSDEINSLQVQNLPKGSGKGWIITVSIQYPDEIKEHTKDFPLRPTKYKLKANKSSYDFEHNFETSDSGLSNLLLT